MKIREFSCELRSISSSRETLIRTLLLRRKSQLLLALLFFYHVGYCQQEEIRVLFVGNSYTYFFNLPQTVSLMAEAKGVTLTARQSTAGGATWQEHWEGEKSLKTRDLIADGDWDYVVLQNHSLSAFNRWGDFMEYGQRLAKLVRSSGAEPVLYATWAREFDPLMQDSITLAYQTLAESIDAAVVPVGPVWSEVRKNRPDLKLFVPDQSHPSNIGTYLIGCVFTAYFTGKPAHGIPPRLTTTDKDGEKLYIAILDQKDAQFLHRTVDNFDFSPYTK